MRPAAVTVVTSKTLSVDPQLTPSLWERTETPVFRMF